MTRSQAFKIVYASNHQPVGDRVLIARFSEDGQKIEIMVDPRAERWSEVMLLAMLPSEQPEPEPEPEPGDDPPENDDPPDDGEDEEPNGDDEEEEPEPEPIPEPDRDPPGDDGEGDTGTNPPPATGGSQINPPLPPDPVKTPTLSATKAVSSAAELLSELKAARGGEVFKIDADLGGLALSGIKPASEVTVLCRDFDYIQVKSSANLAFAGAKRTAKGVKAESYKRLWDVQNSADIRFLDNTVEGDTVTSHDTPAGAIYMGFGASWLFTIDNGTRVTIDGVDAYNLQHGALWVDGVDGIYRNFHTHELREDSWRVIGMDGMLVEKGRMNHPVKPENDPKHPDLGGQMYSKGAKRPNQRTVVRDLDMDIDGGDLTQGFFWFGWKAEDGVPRWGTLTAERLRARIAHKNALCIMGFQKAYLTDIELAQKLTARKSYTDLLKASGGKYDPSSGLFKPQLQKGDVPEVYLTRVQDALKGRFPDGRMV